MLKNSTKLNPPIIELKKRKNCSLITLDRKFRQKIEKEKTLKKMLFSYRFKFMELRRIQKYTPKIEVRCFKIEYNQH